MLLPRIEQIFILEFGNWFEGSGLTKTTNIP